MTNKPESPIGSDEERVQAAEAKDRTQAEALAGAKSRLPDEPRPSNASITDILEEGKTAGHEGGQLRGDQTEGHRGGAQRQNINRGRD